MSALLVDLGAGPVTGAVPVVLVSGPAQNPEPPPGQGPEFGKASPVALVVIVLLGLATVLLIRSMNKRIRRLPTAFQDPAGSTAAEPTGAAAAPTTASTTAPTTGSTPAPTTGSTTAPTAGGSSPDGDRER